MVNLDRIFSAAHPGAVFGIESCITKKAQTKQKDQLERLVMRPGVT